MMARLFRRIQYWLRHRQLESDLREELETHRLLKQEELERTGMSAREAAAASRRALGNVTLAREDARAQWIWAWVDSAWQDVRYALRSLRRQPAFAALAVGTLALGIGLNTAVFDVYSALTMRPWPAPDAERLVKIFSVSARDLRARAGGGPGGFSQAELRYFVEHSRTFTGFMLMRSGGGDRTLGDDDIPASWVSGSFFQVLGIRMAAGRGFTPEEDRLEAPAAVAVLSHGYWQRQFGGDPALPGRTIRLEDVPFTVVGVAPASFAGTTSERVDIWMPIASAALLRPNDRWVTSVAQKPESCCMALAGRLARGVTRERAQAELTIIDRQFREGRNTDAGGVRVVGTQHNAGVMQGGSPAFAPIFGGVVLVLLLSCANVGNLLVARAAARRREIGVRLSLGASRTRVIRQLFTESLALATLAGGAGLILAAWLTTAFDQWSGLSGLRFQHDAPVLGYALALTVLSCIVFGLAPALHGTRASIGNALKDVRATGSPRLPLRSLLMAIQVAVAVVLLVACGLLARAVYDARWRDLGYPIHELTVTSFETPTRGYDAARIRTIARQLAASIEALPFRGSLALASTEPLGSGNIKGSFRVPGVQGDQNNAVYEVSPSYFDLAGLTIVAGRALEPGDAGRNVIVIGETMARQYWTIPQAVGQRILVDPATGGWNTPGELEIVGVVTDIHQTSITTVDSTVIYQPLSGRTIPRVLIRSSSEPAVSAVTAAAAQIDPRLRPRTRALADNLDTHVGSSRNGALLAGALGGLALLLATIGMVGVFSYWVQQRTREIGVHMALGATSPQVIRLVLGSSARSLAAGVLAGAAGAAVASRLLQSYLFGISTLDPLAYVGVLLVLASAGAVASYWPARRATRVDPVVALRCE
jgi:predicted permease